MRESDTMSNQALRSKLIRLAHSKPELRADLLPLLKEAGCEKLPEGGMRDNCEKKVEEGEKTDKKASQGLVLSHIFPSNSVSAAYNLLAREDEQAAKLLYQVFQVFEEKLKLSGNESAALNRLEQVISNKNWDAGLKRNNIFKAADLLGLKLPSMMF